MRLRLIGLIRLIGHRANGAINSGKLMRSWSGASILTGRSNGNLRIKETHLVTRSPSTRQQIVSRIVIASLIILILKRHKGHLLAMGRLLFLPILPFVAYRRPAK